MPPPTTEDETDPVWEAFARRHAGNEFLEHEPLYALSKPIIDAIKAASPGFFSPKQERFERDLARTASFGFFYRRAQGRSVKPPPEEPRQPSLDKRRERSARQINKMLGEEMKHAGASDYDIKEFFTGSAERRGRVEDRQAAYAGWLVTDPLFRHEAKALRERWDKTVREIRRFPALPVWILPDETEEMDLPAGFREEFEGFYCRWNLETMRTWDWPAPMEPDFVGGLREKIRSISEAGINLFVPWYIVRGERIDLQDVVRLSRIGGVPEHLADWVNKRTPEGGEDLGDLRYKNLLWLFRFHELVLRRRYGAACKGNMERLDRALAIVLKRDQDSVKKLRLQLRRALDTVASDQSLA